jgi:tripartite-type tricarboxylate transporter receptor subunit TctC
MPHRVIAWALAGAVALAASLAHAFPVAGKPIRIVVPLPAGGHADLQARIVARKLSESMAIPVIVENRPGASTLIATREVIAAAPDGHTLLATFGIVVMLPLLHRAPPYDFFRDLAPVTQVSLGGLILTAHASVPAGDVHELLRFARANPGVLSYASSGAGTSSHLNGELLSRLTGARLVHVPYKGGADAARDLLAGRVQLFFDATSTALANARTGKVRLVAAATEKRIPALPGLPTLREAGVDIASDSWLGLFGPGAMAKETVQALYGHLARAILDPETRNLIASGGAEATALAPDAFGGIVRAEHERWGPLIRELGIVLD